MKHSIGAGLCSLAMGCMGLGLVLILRNGATVLPPALGRIYMRDLSDVVQVGVNVFFLPVSWLADWYKAPWIAGGAAAIVWSSLCCALLLLILAGTRSMRPQLRH
jgi:hypothetical protein